MKTMFPLDILCHQMKLLVPELASISLSLWLKGLFRVLLTLIITGYCQCYCIQ